MMRECKRDHGHELSSCRFVAEGILMPERAGKRNEGKLGKGGREVTSIGTPLQNVSARLLCACRDTRPSWVVVMRVGKQAETGDSIDSPAR
jgi:hypothetical protein